MLSISFLIIFPFIQRQWFNLHTFNLNHFSFYSILYYLSCIICPVIVVINSLRYFTYYKFDTNNKNNRKLIQGKKLFFFVSITLIPLSYIASYYFYKSFNLTINLFLSGNYLFEYIHQNYIFLLLMLILIFRKLRLFIKKLVLLNFTLNVVIIWYLHNNNYLIRDKLIINTLTLNDFYLINVAFLIIIEILYFIWSLLSFKNNLSDWSVPMPLKYDFENILKILFFYFFVVVYYLMLK